MFPTPTEGSVGVGVGANAYANGANGGGDREGGGGPPPGGGIFFSGLAIRGVLPFLIRDTHVYTHTPYIRGTMGATG